MELNKIKSNGSWGKAADDLNQNFSKVDKAVEQVKNATTRNKGYFSTDAALKSAFNRASLGDIAYVGSTYPYQIWVWNGTEWENTHENGGQESVNLGDYYTIEDTDKKLSELGLKVGSYQYNEESVTNKSNQWLVRVGKQNTAELVINVSQISGTVVAEIGEPRKNADIVKHLSLGKNVLNYSGEEKEIQFVINVSGSYSAVIGYGVGEKSNIQDLDIRINNINEKTDDLEKEVFSDYKFFGEHLKNQKTQYRVHTAVTDKITIGCTLESFSGSCIMQLYSDDDYSVVESKTLNVVGDRYEITYKGEPKRWSLIINTNGSYSADVYYELGEKTRLDRIEKRVETVEGTINPIKELVYAKPITSYGYIVEGDVEAYDSDTILAYTDSLATEKSLLKSIQFEPINTGEYTFGIGEIDWRGWGIIRQTFAVKVTDVSFTSYDVSSANIVLNVGETIFMFVDSQKNVKFYTNENTTFVSKKDEDNVYRQISVADKIDETSVSAGPSQGLYSMVLPEGKYRFDFKNIQTSGTMNYGIQVFPSGETVYRGYNTGYDSFEYVVDSSVTSIRLVLNVASDVVASLDLVVSRLNPVATNLQWQVVPFDSIFAEKSEIKELKSSIDSVKSQADEAYNNIGLIYDELGYPHKMSLVNGLVSTTPVGLYKNIAIIGNSLLTGFDEPGTGLYGMAASVYSNDFCGLIMKELRKRYGSAKYTRCQGSVFEQNLFTDDISFGNMTSNIPKDVDLIIIRLGENVRNTAAMQSAFILLIKYLKKSFTQATIVMTSTVLNYSAAYNEPLKAAALSENIKFIDIDGSNYDTEMIGISRMYYQQGTFKPSYFAIQTHSNDLGFLKIANAILTSINYNKLNISHLVNVSSSVKYDAPKEGVEGGWVTIKTYDNVQPNVSVIDSNGKTVEVQHFDLSTISYDRRFRDGVTEDTATYASVFKMTDNDVSVTIRYPAK